MGGEGSMIHMIQTLRNNRELRRSKKRLFQNRNGEIKTHYREIKTKEFTQEQIEKSIKQIQKRSKRERIWKNVIYSILFSLFALLVIYLIFFVL